MKLVEIVSKYPWNPHYDAVTQDSEGRLHGWANGHKQSPLGWTVLASDHKVAKVTRQEWEALRKKAVQS